MPEPTKQTAFGGLNSMELDALTIPVHRLGKNCDPIDKSSAIALASIAISLKRIADRLEQGPA